MSLVIRRWVLNPLSALVRSTPLQVFAVTRLGLMLCMFLSLAALPMVSDDVWRGAPDNLWLDGWGRWDSGWYKGIADDGYRNLPNDAGQRDTAFFPLYPLLIRVARPIAGSTLGAGVLVSNLAFAWGLVLLFGLVERKFSRDIATRTVILTAIYPFAFYFGAVYTDSLFFLGTVGAFHYAEKARWLPAALFAASAGATKTIGVALCLPLALLYMSQRNWNFRALDGRLVAVAAPVAGMAGYMTHLYFRFHDPIAFVHAQNALGWSTHAAGSDRLLFDLKTLFTPSSVLAGDFHVADAANLFAVVWALPLAVASFRIVGSPYAVWSLTALVSSLTIWVGFGRYAAPVFPLFVTMATFLRKDAWLLAVGFVWTLLLALLAIMYGHFYWVA